MKDRSIQDKRQLEFAKIDGDMLIRAFGFNEVQRAIKSDNVTILGAAFASEVESVTILLFSYVMGIIRAVGLTRKKDMLPILRHIKEVISWAEKELADT